MSTTIYPIDSNMVLEILADKSASSTAKLVALVEKILPGISATQISRLLGVSLRTVHRRRGDTPDKFVTPDNFDTDKFVTPDKNVTDKNVTPDNFDRGSRARITVAFKDLDPIDLVDPIRVDNSNKGDREDRESVRGEEEKEPCVMASAPSTPEGVASPSPPGCAAPPSPSPRPPKVLKQAEDTPEFTAFWKDYPRKVGKVEARRVWNKLAPDPDTVAAIMDGLELCKRREWNGREMRMIPHATTWLNQRRWEDGFDQHGHAEAQLDTTSRDYWTGGRLVPRGAVSTGEQPQYDDLPF